MASRLEELEKKRNEIWDKFAPLTERMKAALPKDSAEYKKLDEEARQLRGEYDGASTAYTTEKNKEAPKSSPKEVAPTKEKTVAPKTPTAEEVPAKQSKVSPNDYPAILYGLHKHIGDLKKQFKNASETERPGIKKAIEQAESARDKNLAHAQRYYGLNKDSIPSRYWDEKTNQPYWPGTDRGPDEKALQKFRTFTPDDIPPENKEWPKEFVKNKTFQKLMQQLEGGPKDRAKNRLITHELKKTLSDVNKLESDLKRWEKVPEDPRSEKQTEGIKKQLADKRPYHSFLQGLKNVEPSKKLGDYDYNDRYKAVVDSFDTEQSKAFKDGKEVTLNPEQKNLYRDYKKTRIQSRRDLDNQFTYVSASPDNTTDKWRSMSGEQRTDALSGARERLREDKEAQGVLDYFTKETSKPEREFFNLDDKDRNSWLRAHRANESKEAKSRGEAPPNSLWDTLFGKPESEFVSNFAPELRKPMSQAAKSGFEGIQSLVDELKEGRAPFQQATSQTPFGKPLEPFQRYIPRKRQETPNQGFIPENNGGTNNGGAPAMLQALMGLLGNQEGSPQNNLPQNDPTQGEQ